MITRHFWIGRIEHAWTRHPVVWLMGVRRAGKTLLARSLAGALYFDCELPSVRRMLNDPESFLDRHRGSRIVLDEVHRLANPSEILKIAADHYPDTRVLATGSSSLGASIKFRDTLTGRKTDIWLTPMNSADCEDFAIQPLDFRLVRGGLPAYATGDEPGEKEYAEWMESYLVKDIQELFRLDRWSSFRRFLELVIVQSGGIFEATRFAAPCEVSRPTIATYLGFLERTFVAHVIRPFSTRRATEIVAAPKVYAFDTGFVCAYRGWTSLRPGDHGPLWEHYVLNEIHSYLPALEVQYWRDKQRNEVDFVVIPRRGRPPVAIECKWSADDFDPKSLKPFRALYEEGPTYVVSSNVRTSFSRTWGRMRVEFVSVEGLIAELSRLTGAAARKRAAH